MPDLADWRERLRGAIRRTGRRQNAIAEQAGVSPETLSKILTGGHANPRFETVVAIVHAAGESVGWLLREPQAPLSGSDLFMMREIVDFLDSHFPAGRKYPVSRR
jgi:transcriptional regulator with XRE-family HTH domain